MTYGEAKDFDDLIAQVEDQFGASNGTVTFKLDVTAWRCGRVNRAVDRPYFIDLDRVDHFENRARWWSLRHTHTVVARGPRDAVARYLRAVRADLKFWKLLPDHQED